MNYSIKLLKKNIALFQAFYSDTRMLFNCEVAPIPRRTSISDITSNLDGEISQHMKYLPFGETLVEEHLNSNNSPYKFNAEEYDSETGNYYYGARYYSPRYNLMLSVDPAYEMYPGVSPFVYTLQNPVRYVDPTGMFVESPDNDYGYDKKTGELKMIKKTNDNFDRIYSGEFSEKNEFKKDDLLLTLNKGTLVEEFDRDFSKEGLIFSDLSEGLQAMKALSFSAEIEFSAWAFKDDFENQGLFINPWSQNTYSKSYDFFNSTGNKVGKYGLIGKKTFFIHTHPSTKTRYGNGYPSPSDEKHYRNHPNFPHYILSRNHGVTRHSTKTSTYTVKDLDKYFKNEK